MLSSRLQPGRDLLLLINKEWRYTILLFCLSFKLLDWLDWIGLDWIAGHNLPTKSFGHQWERTGIGSSRYHEKLWGSCSVLLSTSTYRVGSQVCFFFVPFNTSLFSYLLQYQVCKTSIVFATSYMWPITSKYCCHVHQCSYDGGRFGKCPCRPQISS